MSVTHSRSVSVRRPAHRSLSEGPSEAPVAEVGPAGGVRVFHLSLALFVAVAVAKIHEVIPGIAPLRLGKLLIIPLLVTAVIALPRWQLLSGLRTTIAKSTAVIAALGVLGIPLSIWPSHSASFFINAFLPAWLLFLLASVGFVDRRTAALCIGMLVFCVSVDAIYLLSGAPPVGRGRPYIGTGLDSNESAALFVSTLPFAAMLAAKSGSKRWLGLAASALFVAGVVKTGSRGGVLGLVVVAFALLFQARPRQRWAYLLALGVGVVGFAITADETTSERFRTLLAPQTDYNVTDSEGRLEVWNRGVRYMLTRPVLGVGIDGFETAEGVLGGKTNQGFGIKYTASHNAFIQIGAELGLPGLAAFLVAFWSGARACRRIRRGAQNDRLQNPVRADEEAELATAAFGALLGIASTGFFLSLAYHPITFFIFGVCSGILAGSPFGHARRSRAQRTTNAGSVGFATLHHPDGRLRAHSVR